MGQYTHRTNEYREAGLRKSLPKHNPTYAYGQLAHYGEPSAKAYAAQKSREALLHMSENHEARERTERMNADPAGWKSTPEMWARVGRYLKASPTMPLIKAKELAVIAGRVK